MNRKMTLLVGMLACLLGANGQQSAQAPTPPTQRLGESFTKPALDALRKIERDTSRDTGQKREASWRETNAAIANASAEARSPAESEIVRVLTSFSDQKRLNDSLRSNIRTQYQLYLIRELRNRASQPAPGYSGPPPETDAERLMMSDRVVMQLRAAESKCAKELKAILKSREYKPIDNCANVAAKVQ